MSKAAGWSRVNAAVTQKVNSHCDIINRPDLYYICTSLYYDSFDRQTTAWVLRHFCLDGQACEYHFFEMLGEKWQIRYWPEKFFLDSRVLTFSAMIMTMFFLNTCGKVPSVSDLLKSMAIPGPSKTSWFLTIHDVTGSRLHHLAGWFPE